MQPIKNPPSAALKLVHLISTHPKALLLGSFLIVLALTPFALTLSQDFTHQSLFREEDPLVQDYNNFEEQFGNDDSVTFAIHSPSGIFDQESIELLQALTEEMKKLPDISRVTSLTNFSWVYARGDDMHIEPFFENDSILSPAFLKQRKNIALAHEVMPNYLISKDAKTAIAYAHLRPGSDPAPEPTPIIEAATILAQQFTKGDHTIYITGGPAINHAFKRATAEDLSILVPIMLLLIIVLLAYNLRSVGGIFLSLLVVAVSLATTFGISGLLGFPITTTTGILPQILIAIGIADAVHILVVFFRALRHNSPQTKAAEYSLLKNFQPTLLTSVSTAIGFFSFSTSGLKSIYELGVLAGTGVLFAWFATYFVLGPLLFIVPVKIAQLPTARRERSLKRATYWGQLLKENRVLVTVIFAVCSIGAFALTLQNRVNSDPYHYFAEGVPIRDANDFVTDTVGGARWIDIVIRTDEEGGIKEPEFLQNVASFQTWIEKQEKVTRTVSIANALQSSHRSLNGDNPEYYSIPDSQQAVGQLLLLYTMGLPEGADVTHQVNDEEEAIRLTVLWSISDSETWIKMGDRIANEATRRGFDFTITGKGNLYQRVNPYLVSSFSTSLSIALILISILLIIVFRSVKLGSIALLTNCIPLVFGGSIFFIMGKTIDPGSVLVMSVCLGIAVDDTIHMLSNYNRLRTEGYSAEETIIDLLANTSPALIATTMILVCGFGTLAFGTFVPNVYFGIMTAVILSIALLTDLTFLPAILSKEQKK